MLRFANVAALVPGGAAYASWAEDGALLWSDDEGDIRRWHPDEDREALVVELGRLVAALSPLYRPGVPPSRFEFLDVRTMDLATGVLYVAVGESEYGVDLSTYEVAPVATGAARGRTQLLKNAVPSGPEDVFELASPDHEQILGLHHRNVYLRSTDGSGRRYLTSDTSDDVEWRYPESAWSPDGRTIVALRTDFAGIPRRALVHWTDDTQRVEFVPRAEAGQALPSKELFSLDPGSGTQQHVADADEDHNIRPLGWSGEGNHFYFLLTSRDLRHIRLMVADRTTGSCVPILDERHATLFSWADLDVLVTPVDGWRLFLWRSERDGWAHLYLYDGDGNPVRQLTSGELAVVRVVAVDDERGWVYFVGQSELRPYDTHLYRVHLDDGRQTRLTDERGIHDALMDPSMRYFLDRHSTLSEAPSAVVRRTNGSAVKSLGQADTAPLRSIGWSPPEEVVLIAADGSTELHGVIFKPATFDESKRYPLVDWIYGGPQMMWAPKSFLDPLAVTPRAMAQLGVVVLVMDSRGTPGRGKAFHDVASGTFGAHVVDDHVAAIGQLAASRDWIDIERVGIAGGSWGGYMTIRALLTAPDTFKVGVALNSPVTNREGAETIEPFLGKLGDNPDGYRDADLLPLAPRLEGQLLMMAGNLDTLFGSTMRMADAFVKAGKDFDLVVLPDEPHAIGGDSARFMLRKRAAYFVDHLFGPDPS